MEGVIVKFNTEKGFGFIEGEDSKSYFFHKDRIDPVFLEIDPEGFPFLYNYYFTDDKLEDNRPVCILEFDPLEGKKGLIASHVKPTSVLLNSEKNAFTVVITDLSFENCSMSYYDNHPNYGAIAREYSSNVWMSYRKVGGYGKGKVDIRSKILEINDRQKITRALIERISNNIVNKKIVVSRYKDFCQQFPTNISDVVFHGSEIIHSVYQLMLNWEKISNPSYSNNLYFDYDILKL